MSDSLQAHGLQHARLPCPSRVQKDEKRCPKSHHGLSPDFLLSILVLSLTEVFLFLKGGGKNGEETCIYLALTLPGPVLSTSPRLSPFHLPHSPVRPFYYFSPVLVMESGDSERWGTFPLHYFTRSLVRLSTRRNLEILQEQSPSLTRAGTASSPSQFPRHHWDALAPQETKSVHNPGPNKGPPSSASWVPPRGEMSRLTV